MFQITLCKNVYCSQPVPDSLNKGVKRKYCSAQCSNRQAQRDYRARSGGSSGDGAIGVVNGHPFVRRTMAPTAKAAEKRFKDHLLNCAVGGGGVCPGRIDPYDRRRLCLIRAVLREDWDQLRRAEQGTPWERVVTNENGFWLDAPEAAMGTPLEGSDELGDFVEAGGGSIIT